MKFGYVDRSLGDVDFTLPSDNELTKRTLKSNQTPDKLEIYVGASKWGEKSWKGIIYPRGLQDKKFLNVYSQNFNTVEFGPSFYMAYSAEQISKWAEQVSNAPGFKFCPKFTQSITHIRRLAHAEQQTADFYRSLNGFGNHLGPLLLQLSDNFSPKSFTLLQTYLQGLDPAVKVCVEVRNKDWFSDAIQQQELFHMLSELHIGTVITDTAGRRDAVHTQLTTTDAFIRFVGNNLHYSDYKRLDDWVGKIKAWSDAGLQSLWFFMHQNDEIFVPQACDYFIKKLSVALGTSLSPPRILF